MSLLFFAGNESGSELWKECGLVVYWEQSGPGNGASGTMVNYHTVEKQSTIQSATFCPRYFLPKTRQDTKKILVYESLKKIRNVIRFFVPSWIVQSNYYNDSTLVEFLRSGGKSGILLELRVLQLICYRCFSQTP
jgi:hypothetical protein